VVRERVANGNLGVKSGRGFFEWTDERARAVRAVRDQFLLARLKERRAARSAQGAEVQAGSTGDA
jgi:3-hydroxyacyl-CoA dehydrogenase